MIGQIFPHLRRFFRRRNHPRWIELETVLEIPIFDYSLFEKALRHPSVERVKRKSALESYERLEFLGDAILGSVVAEYLYHKYPGEMEGFLSSLRSRIVSGHACAAVARTLGLGKFVELDPAMASSGGHERTSVLADVLESIIGAIHLDSGTTNSRRFIHQQILEQIDFPALLSHDDNFKSRLQEFVQAEGWEPPQYLLVQTDGPPHQSVFTVDVYICGRREGTGQATSKKKAEQSAAYHALTALTSNSR
ncbi:MAG: ribonuclease III [Bacteroidetes bacterium]|nr:ribonuclease III [Bacteroidota bacterium]